MILHLISGFINYRSIFYEYFPLGNKKNLNSRDSKHGSAVYQKVVSCIVGQYYIQTRNIRIK